MGKFLDYNPDQAYLLPRVCGMCWVRGICVLFLRRVVAKLDLNAFRDEYGVEGGQAYAPEMLISVCGCTGSRAAGRCRRDGWSSAFANDLAFRYLAGEPSPDHWTLNDLLRRRHAKGLNDLFTHVVELARASGMGKLGHVASTRRALRPTPRGSASTPIKRCALRERDSARDSPLAEAVRRGGPQRRRGQRGQP